MKSQIDFQKCIPVSADKDVNYEEPERFPAIYTSFG